MKRKLFSLICGMLCILTLAQPVLAAGETATAEIPVSVILKDDVPSKPETFNIVLKPNDQDYPMPEDTEDGKCILPIKGEDDGAFVIEFGRVGVYEYTVYQQKGKDSDCKYDTSVYHVVVTITNAEDGGLESTVAIRKGDADKKTEIEFVNVYPYHPYDNPKTDDESNFPLYATLAAGSVLVLVALYLTRKREEDSI
ncbi:MAG: FctA domain-containing protein [Eubacteriales bacterium]|nr:FctA domain-containing protein [Eubacteriales bacterium]